MLNECVNKGLEVLILKFINREVSKEYFSETSDILINLNNVINALEIDSGVASKKKLEILNEFNNILSIDKTN